jgi:hypothetical protein
LNFLKSQRKISESNDKKQNFTPIDKKRTSNDLLPVNPSQQKLIVGAFFTENDSK